MSWRTMKTVGLLNSKETVSKILRIFWTDLHWTGGGGGEEERQCWVCFASEEDDPVAAWVHPCLCKGTTKWVHQVWHLRVKHAHCKSFVGLYPTLGGWETEREQQHGCCVSSMWRWLYHTGCNSPDIWILDISKWFSLSFPPLRLFFDFLMPWISWCVSVSKKNCKLKDCLPWENHNNHHARSADCARLLLVECVWGRSTGPASHMGQSQSCRYAKVSVAKEEFHH